jgi:hypothetical protein
VFCLSPRVHEDPHAPDAALLPIPLHGQSPLDDLQKMTSQTQNINMGRQASESSDLSGAEGRSGPRAGTAEASEVKTNKWERRKSRKIQGKIAKLAEDKIFSTCILQNLDKALANLRRGKDQVNMEMNEIAEPGQAGVGKERNAATPVSRIGEAWDFVNMGIEVETTPEVELPLPPGWATHEEQGPEAEITITDSVAYSKEEKAELSPLEKLQARLSQSKMNRQPKESIKKLIKKQAILDSGATSTFMRAQDGAIPTGERSTKRVQLPDGRAVQASEKAKLPPS